MAGTIPRLIDADLTTYSLPLFPGGEVEVDSLKAKHELYDKHQAKWALQKAAYKGIDALLELDIIEKHERESDTNFSRRKEELVSFGYTKSVVDLFTFYLHKRDPKRELGPLGDDALWQEFVDDCDLYGTTLDEYFEEQSRYASMLGHVGILVDKPNTEEATVQESVENRLYPYLATYHPSAILDWQWERDQYNRPFLAYLKLLDDDGTYRLWWPTHVELWAVVEDETSEDSEKAEKIDEYENSLGEIPFVWLYNERTDEQGIGGSDVENIARLDVSITRNVSQGEEVITYTAFPMLRAPKLERGTETRDEVGEKAVLEFDPELGDAGKPDWLAAETEAPVNAILAWIARKVAEIYRASNAGGQAAMEDRTQAESGVALTIRFQLLNSKLVKKASNLDKTEKTVIWHWLRWQRQEGLYDGVSVTRPKTYDVENLAADLENALVAMSIVNARKFHELLQKMVARRILPSATEQQLNEIDGQIETEREYELQPRRGLEFKWREEEDLDLQRKRLENERVAQQIAQGGAGGQG